MINNDNNNNSTSWQSKNITGVLLTSILLLMVVIVVPTGAVNAAYASFIVEDNDDVPVLSDMLVKIIQTMKFHLFHNVRT